jgi:hypothetical protein
MGLREKLGGELRWIPSLAIYGEVDAPLSTRVPLGWGCGRTSRKGGKYS